MTEDEKIRADYAASVSLLTDVERENLWQDAKVYCGDWMTGKIPRTAANLAKFKKQVDIFIIDCDPDRLAELVNAIKKARAEAAL